MIKNFVSIILSRLQLWVKNRPSELVILTLILIVYNAWLFNTGLLVSGDWTYHSPDFLKVFYGPPQMWEGFADAGRIDIIPSYDIFKFMYGALSYVFNFAISERLIYFYPILFNSYIGIILLGRKVFGKNQAGILAFGILFLFNTYILSVQTSFMSYANVYALTPIVIYSYLKLFEKNKVHLFGIVASAMILWLTYIYESRATIALAYMLAIFMIARLFGANKGKIFSLINFILSFIILGLLSIFSIIPLKFLQSGDLPTTSTLFYPFNTIQDSLTLHNYAWQGNILDTFANTPFQQINPSFYFYLVTALAFSALLFLKRAQNRSLVITFMVSALVGIFLLKQQNAPFGFVYAWAFENIPTFNLFRESNKFILFALPISLLFGVSVSLLYERIKSIPLKYTFFVASLGLVMVNVIPILNKDIGTLFVQRVVPDNYQKVESMLLSSKDFYRTYWLPKYSRWSYYDSNNPAVGGGNFNQTYFSRLLSNPSSTLYKDSVSANLMLIKKPYASEIFRLLNIKYVFIPDAGNEVDRPFAGTNRDEYVDELKKISWLTPSKFIANGISAFETKNSGQYFFSFANLASIESFDYFDQKYGFIKKNVAQSALFTDNINVNSATVKDLFENIQPKQLGKTVVNITNPTDSESVYVDINKLSYKLKTFNNLVEVVGRRDSLLYADGNNIDPGDLQDKVTIRTPIVEKDKYYLGLGNNLIPIVSDETRNLGIIDYKPILYKDVSKNLVGPIYDNASKTVDEAENCNTSEGRPLIHSNVVYDDLIRENVLSLKTTRGIACVKSSTVNVAAGDDYRVNFQYRSKIGKEALYSVVSMDNNRTLYTRHLPVTDSGWRKSEEVINIPDGVTGIKIVLMASPVEQTPPDSESRYSDVLVTKLQKVAQGTVPTESDFKFIGVKKNTELNLLAPEIDDINLISNSSFEDGLWQKKASDCNDHDDNRQIGTRLVGYDDNSKRKYLELSAKTHIACVSPRPINVEEGKNYLLSFDYASNDADSTQVSVSFNDPLRTIVAVDSLDIKNKSWNNSSRVITAPIGATAANLVVYARSKEDTTGQNVVIKYDNFLFKNIPSLKSAYFTLNNTKYRTSNPSSVETVRQVPSQKEVKVKGARDSFYLAMSEGYHPDWRLQFKDAGSGFFTKFLPWKKVNDVSADQHFRLNSVANGWFIDVDELCGQKKLCTRNSDGSYDLDMVAEFTPQRWFNLGLVFSGFFIGICSIYLCSVLIRRLTKR